MTFNNSKVMGECISQKQKKRGQHLEANYEKKKSNQELKPEGPVNMKEKTVSDKELKQNGSNSQTIEGSQRTMEIEIEAMAPPLYGFHQSATPQICSLLDGIRSGTVQATDSIPKDTLQSVTLHCVRIYFRQPW